MVIAAGTVWRYRVVAERRSLEQVAAPRADQSRG